MDARERMTLRQREVIEGLREAGADTEDRAVAASGGSLAQGWDFVRVAMGLAARGILNLRLGRDGSELFWIRGPQEPATGASVPAGFIVVLRRDIINRCGKPENLFLGRIRSYDLRLTTFRTALRHWLRSLGLRPTDLITLPIERIQYDDPVFFSSCHVVVE